MPEFEWQFTLVLLTNGVMIGLMYALIALGFVLIYKATDAINFAQGEFVMFAGFLAAGAADIAGAPFFVCALLAIAGMVIKASIGTWMKTTRCSLASSVVRNVLPDTSSANAGTVSHEVA